MATAEIILFIIIYYYFANNRTCCLFSCGCFRGARGSACSFDLTDGSHLSAFEQVLTLRPVSRSYPLVMRRRGLRRMSPSVVVRICRKNMAMSWSDAAHDAGDGGDTCTDRDAVFTVYFCGTDGNLANPRTLIEYMHAWTCGVDLPRHELPPPPASASASSSAASSAFSSFVSDTGAATPKSPSSAPLTSVLADSETESSANSPVSGGSGSRAPTKANRDPRKHAATHHFKIAFDGTIFIIFQL
jgi:hypothetical protein